MGKLDDYINYIKRALGRKEDADDEESMSEERPRLKWDDKAKRMLWVPTPSSDDDPDIYGLTGEQPKAMPHPEGLFGIEGGGGTQGLRNQPVDPRFMEEIMKPPGESFAFAPLTDKDEDLKWPHMQNDSALNKLLKATNEFDEPFKFNSYGEQIGGPVDEPNPQWDNYAQGSAAHDVAIDQGWGGTEPDISNYSEEGIYSGENNSAHDVKTFAEGFLGTHGLSLTDANGEPIPDIFNYHGIKAGETPITSQHITDYVRSTVGQTDPFNQPDSSLDKLVKATEKDKKFLREYFERIASDKSGSDYYNDGENISPHASFAIAGKGVRDDWEGEEVHYTDLGQPDKFKPPSELRHTDPELPHTKKRGKKPNMQNSALDKLMKAVGTVETAADYWHSRGEGTRHPFTRFGFFGSPEEDPALQSPGGDPGLWSPEAGDLGSQPGGWELPDFSGATLPKYWEDVQEMMDAQAKLAEEDRARFGQAPAQEPALPIAAMQGDGNSSVLWEQFNRKEGSM